MYWRPRTQAVLLLAVGFVRLLRRLLMKGDDVDLTVLGDPGAEHPLGIERHRDMAFRIEHDDRTLAAGLPQLLLNDFVGRLLDGKALVLDQGGDVVRDGIADEELAVSGAGDAARLVV